MPNRIKTCNEDKITQETHQ